MDQILFLSEPSWRHVDQMPLTFGLESSILILIRWPKSHILVYFCYMGVSINGGTPKSSILMGVSLINHPFLGYPHFWKPLHGCFWRIVVHQSRGLPFAKTTVRRAVFFVNLPCFPGFNQHKSPWISTEIHYYPWLSMTIHYWIANQFLSIPIIHYYPVLSNFHGDEWWFMLINYH